MNGPQISPPKPVFVDHIDYENTPSIDFDLGSLNSFNLALSPKARKINLSPRYLSPKATKSTQVLSPNRRHKILQNIKSKILSTADDDLPLNPPPKEPKRSVDTENIPYSANIDVAKSIDSVATSSSTATTIDLEVEYDSIAVGKLKNLQLFDKNIHCFGNIQNLGRAYNLTELNLHSNLISKMQMLHSLTRLKILNLSSNRIESIEGIQCLSELEELNLSSNRIKHLLPDCLASQTKLTKLVLSYNYIVDISALSATHFQSDGTPKLRYLDLKCNKIDDEQQLEHLQHIKSLQTLIIEDNYSSKSLANPICNAQYKHVIADTLPTLKWLNMQLFDAESHASKIQLVIKPPSPPQPTKERNTNSKPRKSKKRSRRFEVNTETKAKQTQNPKRRRHKVPQTKHGKKCVIRTQRQDVEESVNSSTSSTPSDSEYSSSSIHSTDDIKEASPEKKTKIPIQPRLMSPPESIPRRSKSSDSKQAQSHQRRRRQKKKEKMKRNLTAKRVKEEETTSEEMGDTPRIDALLNRFYHRHGTQSKPQLPSNPKQDVNRVHDPLPVLIENAPQRPAINVPSIPLAEHQMQNNATSLIMSQPLVMQQNPENTKRIDLLVERLERLFPNIEQKEEQKEDAMESGDVPIIDDVVQDPRDEILRLHQASQTVDVPGHPQQVELSQDITNEVHINGGGERNRSNIKEEEEAKFKAKEDRFQIRQREMEQSFDAQIEEWKQREHELESRVQALESELEGNLVQNKKAMEALQEHVDSNGTLKAERQSLSKQLSFRENELNKHLERFQDLERRFEEKKTLLQQKDNELKQSQFELTEMKRASSMTTRMQSERISELMSRSNQNEQELLFTKQTNHALNAQMSSLKAAISNFEDDKKLWKETMSNLRDQCNGVSAKMNEQQQQFELRLKQKESELAKVRSECNAVHSKLVMAVKEGEVNKKRAQQMNSARLSDVNDLKILLKESLKSERKLKKTILELNDVVTEQNQSILKYKAELKQRGKEMVKMKAQNQEMTKKMDTDTVIRANLQEKLSSMQQNHRETLSANERLKEELKGIKGQIKGLQDENELLRVKGKELQQRLEADIDELSSLNDKVRVKSIMLNDQNETIRALKADKNALKQTIDGHVEREKDVEDRISDLLAEMDDLKESNVILQKEVDRYRNHKEELSAHQEEASKYRTLYQETKTTLKEKEEIVQYISNEVDEMKKRWDKEKRGIKEEYERESEESTKKLQSIESQLSAIQQRFKVTENKLSAERICRQKWEKQCAEVKAKKEETEQEMRLILTEMERIKKTAAQFAKAFNV